MIVDNTIFLLQTVGLRISVLPPVGSSSVHIADADSDRRVF